MGREVFSYNNPPRYNKEHLYGQNAPIDQNWENAMMASRSTIIEGDLVFYGDGTNWDHVAVIVGWGFPTNFATTDSPGSGPSGSKPNLEMLAWIQSLKCRTDDWMAFHYPLRPIVVERSGSIAYTSWRSLDNTDSSVQVIKIVHINDN